MENILMSEGQRVESKVRLDPDLAEILRGVEFRQKISRQQLIVDAIWFYLEKQLGAAGSEFQTGSLVRQTGIRPHFQLEGIPGDPKTTPQDDHEQALVAATLQFHRERELPNEFREILYVLLKRWLPASFKAGKKTA